jgi:hypothetical protein
MVSAGPGKNARPYLKKITPAKRPGSMAQVVKKLPSKCETLSSNHSTTTKKKKSLANEFWSWESFFSESNKKYK